MSQYVSNESEDMAQVATNVGWSEFCEWVGALPIDDYPEMHHLAIHGWEQDLSDLSDQLVEALDEQPPSDDVAGTVQALIDFIAAHECEIIIVNNGVMATDDDEDDDEGDDEE